jgi:predicted small secreted protein
MRKFMLAISTLWVLLLTGCNTVEGMGQDIQGGGRALEGAARHTKDRL